jgi:hypothetical protein
VETRGKVNSITVAGEKESKTNLSSKPPISTLPSEEHYPSQIPLHFLDRQLNSLEERHQVREKDRKANPVGEKEESIPQ